MSEQGNQYDGLAPLYLFFALFLFLFSLFFLCHKLLGQYAVVAG